MIKKIIILLFILFIFFAFSFKKGVYVPLDEKGDDVIFVVEKGEVVKKISEKLSERKLIRSKFYFKTYVWLKSAEDKLKAGAYVLSPRLNAEEIVNIMIDGKTISDEITIKTIEGWTSREIGEHLEKIGVAKKDDFLEIVGYPMVDYRYEKNKKKIRDFSGQFEFLKDKPDYYGLEGYLFPDTYRVFNNSSADDVIFKMLNNFDKKLTEEMRADIKKQGKTVFQIITMASIVEKEVRTETDMKIVSGLFWNRIKNGQALQSCASLAYILGVNKAQYSLEDTRIDSPYNTYRNNGLPPGPISNPGLKAIKAAIYPQFTNFNYFLSRPDTGETVFSVSYEEHLSNKAKYLR